MSSSSNSYKSRRRFVEGGEWIPPECKCRMKCVERTSWTEGIHGRRFFGCPRYKNNDEVGCLFLKWIDPPPLKSEFDLVRRMEELEEKVKILSKIIQRRDDEVDSLMKFRKVFNVALFVLVLMVTLLLFYYV
uniref:GRF-type domain-containing protein n=1 Tax=Cannabis sativa TaxID=3483 RepID=A0A803QWF5_CANSA